MWKRLKKTLKNRSPGTLKIVVLLRRVAKKDYFHLAAKNSRNGVENKLKIA